MDILLLHPEKAVSRAQRILMAKKELAGWCVIGEREKSAQHLCFTEILLSDGKKILSMMRNGEVADKNQ